MEIPMSAIKYPMMEGHPDFKKKLMEVDTESVSVKHKGYKKNTHTRDRGQRRKSTVYKKQRKIRMFEDRVCSPDTPSYKKRYHRFGSIESLNHLTREEKRNSVSRHEQRKMSSFLGRIDSSFGWDEAEAKALALFEEAEKAILEKENSYWDEIRAEEAAADFRNQLQDNLDSILSMKFRDVLELAQRSDSELAYDFTEAHLSLALAMMSAD